jgi:hypothetical protein
METYRIQTLQGQKEYQYSTISYEESRLYVLNPVLVWDYGCRKSDRSVYRSMIAKN